VLQLYVVVLGQAKPPLPGEMAAVGQHGGVSSVGGLPATLDGGLDLLAQLLGFIVKATPAQARGRVGWKVGYVGWRGLGLN
jgi:hypothetical protein